MDKKKTDGEIHSSLRSKEPDWGKRRLGARLIKIHAPAFLEVIHFDRVRIDIFWGRRALGTGGVGGCGGRVAVSLEL